MKIDKIKCDYCGKETDLTFIGGTYDWITLTRCHSHSDDLIQAGTTHFCAENCLRLYVVAPKKKDNG